MPYKFPTDVERIVSEQMATGGYDSVDDLLRDALRALAEDEADFRAIQDAVNELEVSDGGTPLDEAFALVRSGSRSMTLPSRNEHLWRWTTHVLFGLLVGVFCGAVHREPWNEPLHWANLTTFLLVVPTYLLAYTVSGFSPADVSFTTVAVVVSQAVGFNLLFYVLHRSMDMDFIIGPIIELVIYLVLFAGTALLLKFVRRVSLSNKAS